MTSGQPQESGVAVRMLRAISRWANAADWHTWLLHAVVAVPIMLLAAAACWLLDQIGGFTPLTAGAVATTTFFLWREFEQYAHERMAGAPVDVQDHVLDVLAPSLLVIGLAIWWGAPP